MQNLLELSNLFDEDRHILKGFIIREESEAPFTMVLQNHKYNSYCELTNAEQERKDSIRNISVKKSYHLGRTVIKTAINEHELLPNDTEIRSGVFGQPMIKSADFDLSLSHSGDWATAIVFPEGQQMALDIEALSDRGGRIEAIMSQMTESEKRLFMSISSGVIDPIPYYLNWVMKESLSKVLKCGLMASFKNFAIKDLSEINSCGWRTSHYECFYQYKCYSLFKHPVAMGLILPEKSTVVVKNTK